MNKELINKLEQKQAKIGIVGLGYVGLPLLLRYCKVGYKVLGFDIDTKKLNQLNSGQSYIAHISNDDVASAVHFGFEATGEFNRIKEVDAIIICVPTPLNKYREPDLSFVVNTVERMLPYMKKGQVISLESTTYPGTTEEEIITRLEKHGFIIGEDVFVLYSPEREDPANPEFDTQTIPKVCGGATPNCLEVGKALYGSVIDQVVPVSSLKTAEMTKLLENIHRAVNIGLVNEMKIVADRMGIDIFEVIRAAATKPFGFVPYYPGPGIGGHCIPVDPFYLTWKAREYGLHTRFIELAGEINSHMIRWVMDKTADALNARGKPLMNSKILLLGLAYKKNVDDMRESPAITLLSLLKDKGALVQYSDARIPKFPEMREYNFDLEHQPINPTTLAEYDAVIITTAHSDVDYDLVAQHAQLIVDTRGVYQQAADHIIKA